MLRNALLPSFLLLGASASLVAGQSNLTLPVFFPTDETVPEEQLVGSVITANAATTSLFVRMPSASTGSYIAHISHSIWTAQAQIEDFISVSYSCVVVQSSPALTASCVVGHATSTPFTEDASIGTVVNAGTSSPVLSGEAVTVLSVTVTAGAEKLAAGASTSSGLATGTGSSTMGSGASATPSSASSSIGTATSLWPYILATGVAIVDFVASIFALL